MQWSQDAFDTDFKSMKALPLTNPLVEKNVTFGSSPLIRPTISEKPTIMVQTSTDADKPIVKEVSTIPSKDAIVALNGKESKQQPATAATVTSETEATKKMTVRTPIEAEETSRLRVRKKEHTEPVVVPPPVAIVAEPAKRQRIDLKGPRVKHVCRSASIVLGQPIATFADETPMPEMDTPPRPDSPSNVIMELDHSTLIAVQQRDKAAHSKMAESMAECADSTRLSPPATPITNEYESESGMAKDMADDKVPSKVEEIETVLEVVKKADESVKPITRKVTRPGIVSANVLGLSNKKLNSFSRKEEKPIVKAPPLISIDFWENYDPAEVSQTGFGLIVSEGIPMKALCFLCGSCGQEPMIFCVCCCEPYHQYCVEDGYNMKPLSLDDTNASFLDISLVGGGANTSSSLNNRLNWVCPRCTVCDTCNMASGSKVKCQKCQKNYHSTCLGTSKRLLGADRPLICARCLKCKSCSTTNVSKFVGNLPMCSPCFRLRQKGNFCPLCQKCYEDNDFNIKMMECGDCQRWVHSKCEGLTDEQYNMLSVLPENIEFICKKCARTNALAGTWRDAVAAEFKAGLMSVVKLLSKSRQACALLKLSPRKKPNLCTCFANATVMRSIQFGEDSDESSRLDEEQQDRSPFFKENGFSMTDTTASQSARSQHCYCGAAQKQASTTSQSLLDIKQKVVANKYFSLADFNYDMNLVIGGASCDDLMTAYKEILSETFPWFQNETKACTDALEEDMYDSCNFGQDTEGDIECDQQVPMVNIPDDIDDVIYESMDGKDTRTCMFCKGLGDGLPNEESRMLYCGQNSWVHANCAMWSAEVFEEIDGSLQKVHSAISRGRMIKCTDCEQKGATVGCNVRNCGGHYHYPCARKVNCMFMMDKTVYCPQHRCEASSNPDDEEHNFEVPRAVYVELDRRKRKGIDPSKVQFLIGSLQVKQLGRFVAKLSDLTDAIVPADFLCSRLFWSSKEPWKVVEYTVRTSIQSNLNMALDCGRNFTVDHSTSTSLVQLGLAQITKWHTTLSTGEDNDYLQRQERTMKQLIGAVTGHNEETNEDEPQSNADLLPPEIKDAIFEDLPHDILDGISMLDIFPKLMTYEDLVAMDNKNEAYLTGDMLKDGRDYNMTDDDLSQNSQKDFDGDHWINANIHVEDAMLSSARPSNSSQSFNRDLKRNKTDLFPRSNTNRAHPRTNLNLNAKMDSNATAKRRKMSMLDLRLPESVLLSLGRRKDDHPSTITENSKNSMQSEEIKNKTFTWSAAKKFSHLESAVGSHHQLHAVEETFPSKDMLDRLKISQLDGMDDVSSGSESGSPSHDFAANTMYTSVQIDGPVKCDRCHCSYRTQDSYNRHLQTCEALSTSESDSELTSRTPDMQSPQQMQNNVMITSINGTEYCNIPMMQQSQQQHQPMYSFNGTTLTQMPQTVSIQNPCSVQSVQSNGMPMQMQGMIINPTGALQQQQQQQQIFAQPITLGGLQQQLFQTSAGTFATPQVMTASEHQNICTSSFSSIKTIQSPPANVYRNQLILPQPEKGKKQQISKVPMSPNRIKGRGVNGTKTVQIKKANSKQEMNKQMHIINQGMPIIRPMGQVDGNVIIQQSPTQQPLVIQQLAPNNQNNIMQYVAAPDGNNGFQYFAMPTATQEYKPQPTQYLTPNPLIPGTFQLQSDVGGNLMLANTPNGLQLIQGSGGLQLAQTSQPQVIGTLIQPQNGLQCGMMSNEQMMLGGTPTFEMVTNPGSGCMMLNNQPMYYGLETIVQNTVMQSQQFVSTAMQGILSQNSSFSATTTQVFQASKIEPIQMEMPTGYVVLNNDGTIMQQSAQQPLLSNIMQAQQPQIQQTQLQPTQNTNWRFIEDKPMITQTHPQPVIQAQLQAQPQIMQAPKPVIKSSPIVVSKIQPQNKLVTSSANHVSVNPATIIVNQPKTSPIILPKPTSISTIDVSQLTLQNNAMILSDVSIPTTPQIMTPPPSVARAVNQAQAPTYLQAPSKKSIKPIGNGTKITSATIKPKIISKPITATPKAIKPSFSKDMTAISKNTQIITVTATNVPTSQPSQPTPVNTTIYNQQLTANTTPISCSYNSTSFTIQQVVDGHQSSVPTMDDEADIMDVDATNKPVQKYLSPSQYLPKISEQVNNQISITPIPLSSAMTITPTTYSHQQQQQSTSQSHYSTTVTSQTPQINLPMTTSIQLPQAPYAPSYANGKFTYLYNI